MDEHSSNYLFLIIVSVLVLTFPNWLPTVLSIVF